MFFSDYTCFNILDTFIINRKAGKQAVRPRPWAAIGFRLSGQSIFESDSGKYVATAGSVIYVPSGLAFSRTSTEEELITVHFKCHEKEEKEIEIFNPKDSSLISNMINELYDEWQKKKPGYKLRCASLMYLLLDETRKATATTTTLPPFKFELIKPAVDFMNFHFDNPQINVSMLAQMCNISEEYFRRLYEQEYKTTPHKAIINKRIKKACKLLQSGYYTVAEVANQTGFDDCKYFSTVFRKTMNVSPSQYAKQVFEIYERESKENE